jgi:hypothetical protein
MEKTLSALVTERRVKFIEFLKKHKIYDVFMEEFRVYNEKEKRDFSFNEWSNLFLAKGMTEFRVLIAAAFDWVDSSRPASYWREFHMLWVRELNETL